MNLRKRALRYLAPFKGNIALIFAFNILYAIFSLFSLAMAVPFMSILFGEKEVITEKPAWSLSSESIFEHYYFYMGKIITSYGTVNALLLVALTMITFSFLSNLFRYLAHYNMAPIRAGVLKSFRRDIYDKIMILPLSFYSGFKKGDILNRIGADVQEVEWSIISTIQILTRDPFMLFIYLGTLFSINIKLTVISLVILPVSGILIAAVGKSIKRNSLKAQEILGKMSARFEETIGGLRVIKGYNAIEKASENFRKENRHYTKIATKIHRINELGSPLIEFLSILSMCLILLVGANFVLADPLFKGEIFVMYIVVFARMLPPAKQLVTAFYNIQKGRASTHRISQILDADEVITESENAVPAQGLKDKIEYRDVSFRYRDDSAKMENEDADVLKHINLTIRKGEIVALTGHSGSGKSTLVDLLPRFYDSCRGQILIDGTDIREYSISGLRNLMGIVNQDVILFNDTVFNNIAFGQKNVSREKVVEAAKNAHAHSFIMEMPDGYDTVIGDRGLKLSGGERQRISIARTILKNPDILILDEATSALDTESEYLVQKAMETLLEGKTAIIIAHRLSTIRNADTIIFMNKGKIVERGTHDELFNRKEAYYQFCTLQELR